MTLKTHAQPTRFSTWNEVFSSDRALLTVGATAGSLAGLLSLMPNGIPGARALLMVAFVLIAPGSATLLWVPLPRATTAALVPVLGLTWVALASTGALFAHFWHPLVVLLVLVAASLGSAALSVRGSRRAAGSTSRHGTRGGA